MTLVSAADSSKKSRDFITSNFEVQHLFQDVTMQMHGHHCERHAEGDSTCLRDMRSADVACCGTMCSPFSKQRPKRYQDGNVKAHRDYELSADIVFDWLRHLQPAAGIFENVLGWGHRLDSTHDETPLDEFMSCKQGKLLIAGSSRFLQILAWCTSWCGRKSHMNYVGT